MASQCCALEPFTRGIYGGSYDSAKSHKRFPRNEMIALHPQNPVGCPAASSNFTNCVAPNEGFLSKCGTLDSRSRDRVNGFQTHCLAELDSRSVPNLVSDVGSDESYEEIAVNESSSPQTFVAPYMQPYYSSTHSPYYVVYDPKDYSDPVSDRSNGTIPVSLSQDNQNHLSIPNPNSKSVFLKANFDSFWNFSVFRCRFWT